MSVRNQNLESVAPILATFKISQTSNVDDLKDANIGEPVTISADNTISPIGAGELLLGKLLSLTLTDNDDGDRLAAVQIGGICRLAVSSTLPVIGNRVVGGTSGTVKQSPSVASDPVGGNVARGTVLEVNGTTDCLIYLN